MTKFKIKNVDEDEVEDEDEDKKMEHIRWSLRSIGVGKMSPMPTTKKKASFMWHTLITFISFIEYKLMINVALLLLVGLFVLMMHANFYWLLVY